MDLNKRLSIKWDNTTNTGRMFWVGMLIITLVCLYLAVTTNSVGLGFVVGWLMRDILTGPVGHNKK